MMGTSTNIICARCSLPADPDILISGYQDQCPCPDIWISGNQDNKHQAPNGDPDIQKPGYPDVRILAATQQYSKQVAESVVGWLMGAFGG